MDVCVELLADDIWAAEEYKTSLLSVGVDLFDWLYLKQRPISLPMVTISNIKIKYDKSKYVIYFMNDQNIMFGLSPPYGKI